MRKDRQELQINRQLRRRPMLDQIRPHGLMMTTPTSTASASRSKRRVDESPTGLHSARTANGWRLDMILWQRLTFSMA
jgi:hypothetical protein